MVSYRFVTRGSTAPDDSEGASPHSFPQRESDGCVRTGSYGTRSGRNRVTGTLPITQSDGVSTRVYHWGPLSTRSLHPRYPNCDGVFLFEVE